jgi:cyclopropane-fatty-acyl-phospholipid synthase
MSALARNIISRLLEGAGIRVDGDRPCDLRVNNERFFVRAMRGSLGLGESYVDGDWDTDSVDGLFRRLLSVDTHLHPLVRINRIYREARARLINLQTRPRSRAVAEEHYDLDHRMYARFLGPWNQYTCCFFDGTDDLEEAERIKLEMICDKLEITADDRVLDIGCGWGGFAKYAAATRGCRVVGISLSDEQVTYAREYTAGLPVQIHKMDYRDLPDSPLAPFDKVLICGMIEHVGYKNYRRLMEVVRSVLDEDGLFLLHTIGNSDTTVAGEPWTEKYIFRNSMLPSMTHLAAAAERLFVIEDWENYGQYYAPTLQAWCDNFNRNWDAIKALDGPRPFDERFRRMWNYYLMSFKAAFEVRDLHLWHLVMTRYDSARGIYRRVNHRSGRRASGAPAWPEGSVTAAVSRAAEPG